MKLCKKKKEKKKYIDDAYLSQTPVEFKYRIFSNRKKHPNY